MLPPPPLSHRFPRWASLTAALTLAACSVLQRFNFTPPSTVLEGVTVTSLSVSGGVLTLHLDVHNPNPYELRSTAFSVDVEFDGHPFGQVNRRDPLSLPAAEHARVDLELEFAWAGVGAAARGIIDRGAVNYGLQGRFLVDTPIDQRWVSIGTAGTVSLRSP